MPWKDGYTVSDERGVADGDVRWPEGVRSALRITVVLGAAMEPHGVDDASLNGEAGHFGRHRGLDLILRTLDELGLNVTFAVPGLVAAAWPDTVARVRDAGHELALLGLAHEDVSELPRDEELSRLRRARELLQDAVGVKATGWFGLPRSGDHYAVGSISAATVDLLLQEGFDYLGNSTVDDRPHYWFTDPDEPRAILALPYYYHFDDAFFSLFPARGSGLERSDTLVRNWRAELAAQHRRGGVTSIVMHTHAAGWPSRLELVDSFLEGARKLPGLWIPTSAQLAEHWGAAHPLSKADVLASVWQHHDDSLN